MLDIKDALSTKRYWDGRKFRTLYELKCAKCGKSIWKRLRCINKSYGGSSKKAGKEFYSSTGLCRKCACRRPNVRIRLRPHEWRLRFILRSAKERGLTVGMTYEEFLPFTQVGVCHYCGQEIDWREHDRKNSASRGGNLDRKDNSLGYSVGNCVVCCGTCNRIKNSRFSYEEMLVLAPHLKAVRLARKGQRW